MNKLLDMLKPLQMEWLARPASSDSSIVKVPIAAKLVLSFLLILLLTSMIFSIVGVQIIGGRIVAEAQAKVQTDLNSAREIYLNKLAHVNDVVRFTADRYLSMNALLSGDTKQVVEAWAASASAKNLWPPRALSPPRTCGGSRRRWRTKAASNSSKPPKPASGRTPGKRLG